MRALRCRARVGWWWLEDHSGHSLVPPIWCQSQSMAFARGVLGQRPGGVSLASALQAPVSLLHFLQGWPQVCFLNCTELDRGGRQLRPSLTCSWLAHLQGWRGHHLSGCASWCHPSPAPLGMHLSGPHTLSPWSQASFSPEGPEGWPHRKTTGYHCTSAPTSVKWEHNPSRWLSAT